MPITQQHFDADEAAEMLGISKNTLYSYVSRGLIRSVDGGGKTRARRYVAADIYGLQQRKEQRRNPAKAAAAALHFGDPVLESAITLIADGRLYYRGRDALVLAQQRRFEEVTALLWTGVEGGLVEQASEIVDPRMPLPAANIQSTIRDLVSQGHVADAMQMALLIAAPTDLAAYNQTADAVAKTGMRILNCLTGVLTADVGVAVAEEARAGGAQVEGEQVATPPKETANADSIAQRLQKIWKPGQPQVARLLDIALILCADHELNASSFTARCVASTGSTPYAAVVAALAALQGYKHGGSTREVALFLREADENPERTTQERLRAGGRLPGFGHLLYPQGDPRATLLLELAQHYCVNAQVLATAGRVMAIARQAMQLEPNLDFGLTVLAQGTKLPAHAPFALFALGRTAGWIGHIIEQYQVDRLIRPRAEYTGHPPREVGKQ